MIGRVYLVGMPGSGKSSAGRSLAKQWDARFVDLDAEIERTAGRSIAEIFRKEGEDGFREVEEAALRQAANDADRCVIACGGGIVLRGSNRDVLRQTGTVVYLKTPLDRLKQRVKRGGLSRPLLRKPGDLDRLFAEREPLYLAVAHHVVETDGDPERDAERIRGMLS